MALPRRLTNAVYFRTWACLFFKNRVGFICVTSVRIYQLNV